MKVTHRFAKTTLTVVLIAGMASVTGRQTGAQGQQAEQSPPSGDAKRGKVLFNEAYGCGSCHGVYGTAGTPRLVPMSRPQDNFMRFVRKPTATGMPAFPDASDQQLADVYAYIKSVPTPSPPPLESFPILKDVMKTIRE